jgi:uncharacterized protein (DUF488 family)
MDPPDVEVLTLGFSNRPWEATAEILDAYRIARLVDIRTLPGSRHAPQFNQENLARALPDLGLDYIHLKSLGGLRKPRPGDTRNSGWDNPSFRAYADYMQSPEFSAALDDLIRLFLERKTVYACTEAVFWRCHRALVSDALLIRGFRVGHIFGAGHWKPHRLTAFARVNGLQITYPAPEMQALRSGDEI